MPAWFHPFVEYADDLNQSRLNRPIVEHMDWFPYLPGRVAPRMSRMKTANSRKKILTFPGERAFRISRDHADCFGKKRRISLLSFNPPARSTGSENVCEIGFGRLRYAKARHR